MIISTKTFMAVDSFGQDHLWFNLDHMTEDEWKSPWHYKRVGCRFCQCIGQVDSLGQPIFETQILYGQRPGEEDSITFYICRYDPQIQSFAFYYFDLDFQTDPSPLMADIEPQALRVVGWLGQRRDDLQKEAWCE